VLDLARDAGRGCVLLTKAAAEVVVGVDVSEGSIAAVRCWMPETVQLLFTDEGAKAARVRKPVDQVWRDVQASPSRRLRKPLRALKNGLDR
jgi:hypothetical protein